MGRRTLVGNAYSVCHNNKVSAAKRHKFISEILKEVIDLRN